MKSPLALAAPCLGTLALPAASATFVPLNTTSTCLRTYNDNPTPPPALAVDLSGLGLHAGDRLLLQVVGDMDHGPGGDVFTFTLGVFSSGNTLPGNDLRYRVPGALTTDAPPVITSATYFGARPTDFAQDFALTPPLGITVTAPVGASHLFLAANDQLYDDNSDPTRALAC